MLFKLKSIEGVIEDIKENVYNSIAAKMCYSKIIINQPIGTQIHYSYLNRLSAR
jgi:hypothetical protein